MTVNGRGRFSLQKKVAVVIGGTGVLGSTMARGLAEAGAAVAVVGRSAERMAAVCDQLRVSGVATAGVVADATDRHALLAARDEIRTTLGDVDILVNAAGRNSATPFLEITPEEWRSVLDSNLTSVFYACQVFAETMIARGVGGSIVNISSASSGPPVTKVLTYGAAKAGVNHLTQFLAGELADARIRVNAIVPGFFPAEQNRALLSQARVDAVLDHTPMRRLGTPDELVGTVVWLASEAASGFVTGTLVRVDGGFGAMTI